MHSTEGDSLKISKARHSMSDAHDITLTFSLEDILRRSKSNMMGNSVFTFNEDFARCTSINHMLEILEATKK